MESSFSFEASAGRMKRFLLVLAVSGALGLGAAKGLIFAVSFAVGALLAVVSFHYTYKFVSGIGKELAEKPSQTKAVLVGLRYLFIAGLLYVLMAEVGLNVLAALLGLLTPAGAVVLEMVYQLGSWRRGA